ncbi:MAG: 6-carboxytetrahydropterin synthase QueD [Sphingobacteriia bacterium]|jgi:6-pyruvoyltetrahydropterin/6-carboxytetrahydropterin synthase|nr:6-carboxytetrahydropterin synthase QueD [Sphingobacteriia bacterium]
MPVKITKKFSFESAHYLPLFPEGHKCKRLHGHSFKLEVNLIGEINEQGVVLDFGDIKKIVSPFVNKLDHYCINEIGLAEQDPLLSNPTSENLAKWFYLQLKPLLPLLENIRIQETCTSSCTYSPN